MRWVAQIRITGYPGREPGVQRTTPPLLIVEIAQSQCRLDVGRADSFVMIFWAQSWPDKRQTVLLNPSEILVGISPLSPYGLLCHLLPERCWRGKSPHVKLLPLISWSWAWSRTQPAVTQSGCPKKSVWTRGFALLDLVAAWYGAVVVLDLVLIYHEITTLTCSNQSLTNCFVMRF